MTAYHSNIEEGLLDNRRKGWPVVADNCCVTRSAVHRGRVEIYLLRNAVWRCDGEG
jgi:hypothetical protein